MSVAVTVAGLRDFRRPRLWLTAWVTMIVVVVIVCVLPMQTLSPSIDHVDKIEHVAGYATLAGYAVMLFGTRRAQASAACGLLVLGLALEGVQGWLPWRSAELLDVAANAFGVLLGSLLAMTPASRVLQRLDQAWR